MNKWNYRFIKLAKDISQWSKEGKQVGCVAVDRNTNKVLACGYNGLPSFVLDDCLTSLEQSDKSLLVHHAEHNTLDQLAKEDYFKEIDLYVTKPPCKLCSIKIANSLANIKRLFYIPSHNTSFNIRYDVEGSLHYLKEKGIEVLPLSFQNDLSTQIIITNFLLNNTSDYDLDYINGYINTCTSLVENLDALIKEDTSQISAINNILRKYGYKNILNFMETQESVSAEAFLKWYEENGK